jgi:hypothetical protein
VKLQDNYRTIQLCLTSGGCTIFVMTFSHLAIVILGWVGAAASITAYYLVSTKRVAPDSLRYQALQS